MEILLFMLPGVAFVPLVLAYYFKAKKLGSIVATLISLVILAMASVPIFGIFMIGSGEVPIGLTVIAVGLALLCCLGGVVLYLTSDENN